MIGKLVPVQTQTSQAESHCLVLLCLNLQGVHTGLLLGTAICGCEKTSLFFLQLLCSELALRTITNPPFTDPVQSYKPQVFRSQKEFIRHTQ